MKGLLTEARIIPMIVGNLKRVAFIKKLLPVSTGGTNNARYCYSVWLRHLHYYSIYSGKKVPKVVSELGPGDSLGIGLSALLSGAENYYAFDIQHYFDGKKNVKIFDELVRLFKNRSEIPDGSEFPNVAPVLPSYSFPSKVLTDEVLENSLSDYRIKLIRDELMNADNQNNQYIKYQIPWHNSSVIEKGAVDLILSQAVLEHVDDLEEAYATMALWLSDDGLVSHTIDFKCHGMTKNWNGHWCLSDLEWSLVRGGRIYAINRKPLSIHLKLMKKYGFNILVSNTRNCKSKVSRKNLSKEFRYLSEEDLCTTGLYVVGSKKLKADRH